MSLCVGHRPPVSLGQRRLLPAVDEMLASQTFHDVSFSLTILSAKKTETVKLRSFPKHTAKTRLESMLVLRTSWLRMRKRLPFFDTLLCKCLVIPVLLLASLHAQSAGTMLGFCRNGRVSCFSRGFWFGPLSSSPERGEHLPASYRARGVAVLTGVSDRGRGVAVLTGDSYGGEEQPC